MSNRIRGALAAAVLALSALAAGGCVTNEEGGRPPDWAPVRPAEVPEIAALLPEGIRESGELVIGTNPPFAPAEFKDSAGEIIGFDIDLAQAIADVVGVRLVVQEQDFSLILPSISGGTLDFGASGFTDNEERRATYDFVDYLEAGLQWARQPGSAVTPEDACGMKVAVQRGTVSDTDDVPAADASCARRGLPPVEKLSYPDSGTAATAVVLGRADALSADSPVTAWAVKRAEGKLEFAGDIHDGAMYGWPVPKGSELAPVLAAALQHLIDSGDYRRICEIWGLADGAVDAARINGEEIP
ncbi:ABC transporter substrate-binding protein [Corynebacterium sphenisci DSM 44792]|uniref:ABC transporter substrate-binding protein n=1 Tax=Corynebacterium sphenisci DSM 44792 TaxID=1437874 RepID=A0A1L7CYH6_9CORY|nr:ABC transporter substrate-binding protein [Corynebacterium sphenisci]APT90880.1 ABC transporter substrate-binding protein [Corynebacterium sphenisci DSM 44792]